MFLEMHDVKDNIHRIENDNMDNLSQHFPNIVEATQVIV